VSHQVRHKQAILDLHITQPCVLLHGCIPWNQP